MSALSNYLEESWLNLRVNEVAFTAPSVWAALFTNDPTDAGTGTEVSGGSYARVRIYKNGGTTPTWTLAAVDGIGYKVQNNEEAAFPTATASWGTVTHVGILDAVSAGNLLMHGALVAEKPIGNGDTFKFSAGALVLRLE